MLKGGTFTLLRPVFPSQCFPRHFGACPSVPKGHRRDKWRMRAQRLLGPFVLFFIAELKLPIIWSLWPTVPIGLFSWWVAYRTTFSGSFGFLCTPATLTTPCFLISLKKTSSHAESSHSTLLRGPLSFPSSFFIERIQGSQPRRNSREYAPKNFPLLPSYWSVVGAQRDTG